VAIRTGASRRLAGGSWTIRSYGYPTEAELEAIRVRIRQAVERSEPELVKELLAGIVDEIVVESRKSITPYFVSPGVLMPAPSRRRRTAKHKKNSHCRLVVRHSNAREGYY